MTRHFKSESEFGAAITPFLGEIGKLSPLGEEGKGGFCGYGLEEGRPVLFFRSNSGIAEFMDALQSRASKALQQFISETETQATLYVSARKLMSKGPSPRQPLALAA